MPRLQFITFACNDPDALAEFWAAALDGRRRELPPSVDPVIVERPDAGPNLLFKKLPKGAERDLPLHLDLAVEDREAAVERLCGLGATVRETKTETYAGRESTWTVLADPENNGFCVSEYE
jgi:predicted enzyme related to lactoylglutathione lyase